MWFEGIVSKEIIVVWTLIGIYFNLSFKSYKINILSANVRTYDLYNFLIYPYFIIINMFTRLNFVTNIKQHSFTQEINTTKLTRRKLTR